MELLKRPVRQASRTESGRAALALDSKRCRAPLANALHNVAHILSPIPFSHSSVSPFPSFPFIEILTFGSPAIESESPSEVMTLSTGTRLGRYEIRSQLGFGGMGEVYLAQDAQLDRSIALKVLPADVAGNGERMRRFIQKRLFNLPLFLFPQTRDKAPTKTLIIGHRKYQLIVPRA